MTQVIARWETKGGQRFVELSRHTNGPFTYRSDDGGGVIVASSNADAIDCMVRPWDNSGAGPAFLLALDFPSTKRVI